METGKGVLFRNEDKSRQGEIHFEGFLHFSEEKQFCRATMCLHAEPLPELHLEIENRTISGSLEMNANQQSRAEPDFMNFVNFDGQRYAAGAWVPRKKAKEPWFLLVLRPATPENRMASKLPTLVEIRPVR